MSGKTLKDSDKKTSASLRTKKSEATSIEYRVRKNRLRRFGVWDHYVLQLGGGILADAARRTRARP